METLSTIMPSKMDPHQHEGGEEREWLVDAAAASTAKNHNTGARVLQLLSDSKKKMKLMLTGRVGGSKTPPSDGGKGEGARVFLEQVSHVNNDDMNLLDEDGTTITSIYTNHNHTESAGADESIAKERDQNYSWEGTPKAFDVAQAPVVAAGRDNSSSSNNNTATSSSTSHEASAVSLAREATTTTRFPEIWRKKQHPRTTDVVTLADSIDGDSSSPCSSPCGSTINNTPPPATCTSSIGSTNSKCTLYKQLEHMTQMQHAQKKSDMAAIRKDLMQQQEQLSRQISNEIIHTRHALVAEQELVARRQEQQAQHNVACSRQQEEQNAKLDAILTAIMNHSNNNHTTTSNPIPKTMSNQHFHCDPHRAATFREEEFNYLAALVKQQKREILGWMEEAFAARKPVKKDIAVARQQPVVHGEQNSDDDIATLKAENALLKVKNKSLQEALIHLQWQRDKLLTENAALHETMVAHDGKSGKAVSQTVISKNKQGPIASPGRAKEDGQTITKAATLHGIKMLARNSNNNNMYGNSIASSTDPRKRRQQQQNMKKSVEDCHFVAADDTITFTSTITSSSRSSDDDNDDDQEQAQAQAQDQHECGPRQQQDKRQQPSIMVIVGSRNKSRTNDLEELF